MKFSRREFNKSFFFTTIAKTSVLYFPYLLNAQPAGESEVITVRSSKLIRENNDIKKEIVSNLLNEAVKKITKKNTSQRAWQSLFSPTEKVGIKLSCLPGKHLSSSKGLVQAIVEGLIAGGVSSKNIFIWERTNRELKKAGFFITKNGPHIFGTDNLHGGGYSKNIEFSGSVGTCFSRIMEIVDVLINVPVLKDHDIAGVSIGMKNFYGSIYNPNKFHGNQCDPFVADLCNHPFIKNKLRLTICDASRIQVHNGPAFYPKYAREYGGLLISRDPVALDFTGWQIIEKLRKKMNLKSLKESGREPTYIKTAEKLKLGKATRGQIKIIEI